MKSEWWVDVYDEAMVIQIFASLSFQWYFLHDQRNKQALFHVIRQITTHYISRFILEFIPAHWFVAHFIAKKKKKEKNNIKLLLATLRTDVKLTVKVEVIPPRH